MIDRVGELLDRKVCEVPVGFKWFVPGLSTKTVGFGGEESAGASFLRFNGRETWLVFCNYSLAPAKARIHFPEELSGRLCKGTEEVEVPAQDFLIIKL